MAMSGKRLCNLSVVFAFVAACSINNPAVLCLEIVRSSRSPATVLLGETARLSCASDAPWRWCYWQRGGTRYQAFQGGASETHAPSVSFSNGDLNCDLLLATGGGGEGQGQDYSGTWKCHLADTDLEDGQQVKAERFVELQVAEQVSGPDISMKGLKTFVHNKNGQVLPFTETCLNFLGQAGLDFSTSIPEDGQVRSDQVLNLRCSLTDRNVFPTPSMAIYQVSTRATKVQCGLPMRAVEVL